MHFNSKNQRGREWNIVIIDDDPLVLRVHAEMLKLMGHSVSSFECPKQALEYIKTNEGDIDLVITDYRMPEVDGLELLGLLRELGCNMPSIILTAYTKDVDAELAKKVNAKVVSKPLPMRLLESHVASLQAV